MFCKVIRILGIFLLYLYLSEYWDVIRKDLDRCSCMQEHNVSILDFFEILTLNYDVNSLRAWMQLLLL
jgi:hypothetical protein